MATDTLYSWNSSSPQDISRENYNSVGASAKTDAGGWDPKQAEDEYYRQIIYARI